MTDNELKFMKLFEEQILPNRKNVSIAILKQAADLVGVGINTSCRTCAARSSSDLLNKYGQMKPTYDEYLANLPKEEPKAYKAYLDELAMARQKSAGSSKKPLKETENKLPIPGEKTIVKNDN